MMAVMTGFLSSASADWKEFVPRLSRTGADIEVYSDYESWQMKSGGSATTGWSDLFGKQRLKLYALGYSYHPRFVQFQLEISPALKEESFKEDPSGTTFTSTASGVGYNFRVEVLPKHPYRLSLFASRTEEVEKQQMTSTVGNVETTKGAVFKLKNRPYFMDLHYVDTKLDSPQGFSSDVTAYGGNATYVRERGGNAMFLLSVGFEHRSFSSSSNAASGSTDSYGVNNSISYKWLDLSSSLARGSTTQEGVSGHSDSKDLTWSETLSANLPAGITAIASTTYGKNTNDTTDEGSVTNTDKGVTFSLTQHIYESMRNTYTFTESSNKSENQGEFKSSSQTFVSYYTKKIPWGRLTASVNVGSLSSENQGNLTVINEGHSSVAVPGGSFKLNSQEIDRSTIQVDLVSPLSTGELIELQEGVDYDVIAQGNTFQITVRNIPAEFAVPGVYDFQVRYSTIIGDFKIRTNTFGSNLGLELFNNLLNPFFSYQQVDSTVTSGTFTGVPEKSKLYTAGLNILKDPFRALIEYDRQDSNVNPSYGWRAEINYNGTISDTSRVIATAAYAAHYFSQGASENPGPSYSDKIWTLSATLMKRFPEKRLILSGGGTYTLTQSLTNSESYALNSQLAWNVGKLKVSLGATASLSDAQGLHGVSTLRTHQHYFLKITRMLF